MENQMEDETLDKISFIRKIANKSGYTMKDTKVFLDSFIEVIEECVADETEVNIFGFGKLSYVHLPQRKGFKPISGKPGEGEQKVYPPAVKIVFKLSKTLRVIAKKEITNRVIKTGLDPVIMKMEEDNNDE